MSEYVNCHDNELDDDEDDELTYEQVADRLGEVLPFVEEYKLNLVEDERIDELLNAIEGYIEDIPVSIMGTSLDVEDICTEINENFEGYEIADALFKVCDKTTICQVYDYLKKQELGGVFMDIRQMSWCLSLRITWPVRRAEWVVTEIESYQQEVL